MVNNSQEKVPSNVQCKASNEGEIKELPSESSKPKSPAEIKLPLSLITPKTLTMIPPHILAEAISTLRGPDLRFSTPITPQETEYVKAYVLAQYPQLRLDGDKIDFSTLCINEEVSEPALEEKYKSPTNSTREPSTPTPVRNLPVLDKIQMEPSILLEILTKKSSFTGSFISIPEVHAQNKVMKHCALPDEEYNVLFTPNYKEAMMLVGQCYPFSKGKYYMTTIVEEKEDYIREFATFKASKVILAPESWLDLKIKGSQLSQNFRRKCRYSPKGLFSFRTDINGNKSSLHWISEAHRNLWHVLLDATAQDDSLTPGLHRPDFVLCTLDNTPAKPSKITCLLVRKKSFDTTTGAVSQADE